MNVSLGNDRPSINSSSLQVNHGCLLAISSQSYGTCSREGAFRVTEGAGDDLTKFRTLKHQEQQTLTIPT